MSDIQLKSYPCDRLYHINHTWIKFENSNVVTLGITYFAQEVLGEIDELILPLVRGHVRYGDICGSIGSKKTDSDLIAPVSGVIESINKVLVLNPSVLNDDPYEKGWIARIKLANLYELAELVSATEYQTHIRI